MKKTFYNCSKTERQSKITNRMLISIVYTLIGVFASYFMLRAAKGELGESMLLNYNLIMLIAFIVFACCSIGCYILSAFDKIKPDSKMAALKYKERFRNYGHMCLAGAIISFYVNFAYYTHWLPVESAPAILSYLKNIVKSYYVVFWALGIYGVITVAYHMYLYYIKKW